MLGNYNVAFPLLVFQAVVMKKFDKLVTFFNSVPL